MDIWGWVFDTINELDRRGQHRLAQLMYDFPKHTCDANHAFVDAAYPEALALARVEQNPWIEVFFRHWYLQSQVLRRHRGRDNLAKAVALLELSSQEATKNCPQSVCAVQDLASCYATVDGPGYAQERIDVAKETLARIDPSWDCWQCISQEYFTALADAGRTEEERAARKQLDADLATAGKLRIAGNITLGAARMELREGNIDAADRLAKAAQLDGFRNFALDQQIIFAEIAMQRAEIEQAMQTLPKAADVWPEPGLFNRWSAAVRKLADFKNWAPAWTLLPKSIPDINTAETRRDLWAMATHLDDAGCIRDAITVFDTYFALSLSANAFFSAQEALARIDDLIPQLAKDMRATEEQDARRSDLATARSLAQVQIPLRETLVAASQAAGMADLDAFDAYCRQNPDDHEIVVLFGWALLDEGFAARAVAVFEELRQVSPDLATAWSGLGSAHLATRNVAAVDEVFGTLQTADLPADVANAVQWVLADRHAPEDPARALSLIEAILARNSENVPALASAADLCRVTGAFQDETAYWSRCIDLEPHPGLQWNRIVAGTLASDWDTVRASCAALEIPLETDDGPINEEWEWIRVEIAGVDGQSSIWIARRTGPATAIIDDVKNPGAEQRHGSEVVFDPTPLNALDQTDEAGHPCDDTGQYTLMYPCIRASDAPPLKVVAVEGAMPDQQDWEAASKALADLGATLHRRSDDQYQLWDRVSETKRNGVYAALAIPPDVKLDEVKSTLDTHFGQEDVIWPLLLEELGDASGLESQREVEERFW